MNDDLKRKRNNIENWEKLYDGLDSFGSTSGESAPKEKPVSFTIESKMSEASHELDDDKQSFSTQQRKPYQIHNKYIVSQIMSGFLLIDQQAAHERILYEQYLAQLKQQEVSTQKKLFPVNIDLPTEDAALLRNLLDTIRALGFDMEEFGGNTFTIHGVPAELAEAEQEQELIEQLLEQFKQNRDLDLGVSESAASALATSAAIKRGKRLEPEEMDVLVAQLFACEAPYASPTGRKCFITFELDELDKKFL